MLRSLRHYLRAQSQGHHTIDRLEEKGAERGSARRCSLKGREKTIVHQTNNGTVLKATLGKLLRDWVGGGCICMTVYTEVSEMKVWVTTKLRAITIRGWGYMYLGIYRGG